MIKTHLRLVETKILCKWIRNYLPTQIAKSVTLSGDFRIGEGMNIKEKDVKDVN